jgi:POT family proton-dependent oligopeptide transporter
MNTLVSDPNSVSARGRWRQQRRCRQNGGHGAAAAAQQFKRATKIFHKRGPTVDRPASRFETHWGVQSAPNPQVGVNPENPGKAARFGACFWARQRRDGLQASRGLMNSIVVLIGIFVTLATGVPVALQMLRVHPRGLFILFFTEMWERFSYYGMRGLLVFYLTQHFLFEDSRAGAQYGSYATLVYLLPLIGGVLADRYLGARKAVAFGALLLVAGHLIMAVEGPPARQSLTYGGAHYAFQVTGRGDTRVARLEVSGRDYAFGESPAGDFQIKGLPADAPLPGILAKGAFTLEKTPAPAIFEDVLYLALALIIMGVGFLKANVSTLVGKLYGVGDPRRDPGFTLYYYGVNLGAFWAAILCGYLGETFGWAWGFGLAGVGMLAGYVTFMLGKPLLMGKGEPPDPARLARPVLGPINREWLIYLGVIPVLAGVWLLVQNNAVVGVALGIGAAAALIYVGRYMITDCGRVERERLFLAFVLMAGSIVFFTLFEQAATSLNLFAQRNTKLALIDAPIILPFLGHTLFLGTRAMVMAAPATPNLWWIDMGLDAAQTQSFNAGFILIFAPLFAWVWTALGRRGRDPDPVSKFGVGLLQVGLSFLVIVWAQGLADAQFRLPLIILAVVYLLQTTGELCLSPVGLSEVTKLAPPILVSTIMALWFLATSAAEFVGGLIAGLTGTATAGGQVLDPALGLKTSLGVFWIIGLWAVGFGAAFLILSPFIRRWAHVVKDPSRPAAAAPLAETIDHLA